ncbi:DUF892 family protein [Pseudomonas sp. NFACC25]|jgi:ferritin-like metal-binding protein YciE|uniref:DUF892 family protein n=1 Tax=Pseudomonas sp. NFACC25 TaxID=1566188 RepID=UPI0035324532
MARKTVEDLFIHELSDIYSAEKQITRASPHGTCCVQSSLGCSVQSASGVNPRQIERIDQLVELSV